MLFSLPPTPTFSPTVLQLPGALPSEGLCEMLPAAAIFSAHVWAKLERPPLIVSVGRPLEARRLLISETNSPEEAADAGVAGVSGATRAMTNVTVVRMRNFTMSPGMAHGGIGPVGSSRATGNAV